MIKYFAKKYILKSVNSLIKKLQSKCDMEYYRQKILNIMKYLSNLLEYLDDGEISEEESDKIVTETEELFKK